MYINPKLIIGESLKKSFYYSKNITPYSKSKLDKLFN